MKINSKVKKIGKAILLNSLFVISIIFIANQFEIEDLRLSFKIDNFFYFGLSIIFFFLFYLALSIAWWQTLTLYLKKVSKINMLAFWASQLYKYLPSSLFVASFRVYYSQKFDITVKTAIKATLFENLLLIYSGVILFIGFYYHWSLLLIGILFYLLCLQTYYRTKIDIFLDKLKLGFINKALRMDCFSYVKALQIIVYQLVGWVFVGLALYFYIKSSGSSLSNNALISIVGFQAFSYSASILAVFAPGGLGVKEYVLKIGKIPEAAIINWRVVTILLDLVFGIVSILLIKMFTRK